MTIKLFIKTMGCQMNEYDSARIIDLLAHTLDAQAVKEPEEADILLLNTCSIREKAQEKVFSDLGRWRKIKDQKPQLIIGVGGCVASQEGNMIFKRAPYVDIVFGPQTLHRLPEMINNIQQGQKHNIDTTFPLIEKFDALPPPHANGPTACITIMEGCNNFCSYCVVPYTRGREVSRPLNDILDEIKILSKQGVREVTLLGQNVNHYQFKMPDQTIADLALLIRHTAQIKNIDRIRFMSSHPNAFSASLIDAYRDIPKLANHLHLPVQSGSNQILKAMRRRYKAEDFKTKISQLRKVRPQINISSDFIVGFPGETDEDFEDTIQLVREIQFDHSFTFIYSKRPGTQAAKLTNEIPLPVKKERLTILQNYLNQTAMKISHNMVGTIQTILVTNYSKKGLSQLSGRTENNRIVNFDGPANLIGQFVELNITEALPNSLRGSIIK